MTDKDSEPQISSSAFLRLARLQDPYTPLFPFLFDIAIVNADASIACLELLLTPSLKSLAASCIPDAQQSTFFSFLSAIEQEAPHLQTLILGPGRFRSCSLKIISQFNRLRHLELKHENSELPCAFFENIGSLPMLETLILDVRHVSETKTQSISTEEAIVPPPVFGVPKPPYDFSDFNPIDGNRNEDSPADDSLSQSCHTPISTGFNQLAKLHVIGWLPVLEDLIPRIMSTKLEDVSVTFIRLSYDEWKISSAREKAEAEMKRAEEDMRRAEEEKRREGAEKSRKEAEQRRREVLGLEIESEKQSEKPTDLTTCNPEPAIYVFASTIASTGLKKKKKKVLQEERERLAAKLQEEQEKVATKFREEQERLATFSYDAHTLSFVGLLQTLCSRWVAACLKKFSVCQLGSNFQCLLNPPILPEDIFRRLISLPVIESFEVKGWMLNSVGSVLNVAESTFPKLKTLFLASDSISLFTLRRVAESCPKLESFQCRIDSLSPIPEYTTPNTAALSHGLRVLSVSSSSSDPPPTTKQLCLIARHLYLLFPNLETINTYEGHNAEQWDIVNELVKMCQTARVDDMHRPSATQ